MEGASASFPMADLVDDRRHLVGLMQGLHAGCQSLELYGTLARWIAAMAYVARPSESAATMRDRVD